MAWFYMFAACVFEVIWAIAMKYSDGFTKWKPTAITLVATVLSFVLLAQAVRTLPVGTGYTVLNGVGVAGTVVFGILLFGESSSPFRMVCVALVVVGIIGLRFSAQ